MKINTKEIIKGIITIDGHQVKTGMSISELESVLNIKIENRDEHVGHGLITLSEDEKPISLFTWFKGDTVENLKFHIGGFRDEDSACDYLDSWLEERCITEWVGDSYYQTEFGSITPSLVRNNYGDFDYELEISLEYGNIPSRKFSPIKANKNNSIKFVVDDSEFKIQRIPYREADELPFLGNFLGNEPMSLNERNERHSKDDRKEVINFFISKMENGTETIIGVAEFTYFAVWEAYKNSELFLCLDGLTEEWGIIGFAVEKYGCGLGNKKGITPYILVFETIHNELPRNKEMEVFMGNENTMKLLLQSAMRLTSKYVKIPEEDMTLISVSSNKDSMFSYYKTVEDVFINYQRSEKNATVTKASGNASQNSLKYQLNIPSQWAKEIGLTKEDKSILMEFDGETISITKQKK